MNLIKQVNRSLGLTSNEGKIVIFLIVGIFAGGVAKVCLSFYPARNFNYHVADSTFAARSFLAARFDTTLTDSQRISALPEPGESEDEKKPVSKKLDSATAALHPVNLNTASKEELLALPGIGDVTADLILQFRRDHHAFRTIADLRKIHGIGEKKYSRLRSYVTVTSSPGVEKKMLAPTPVSAVGEIAESQRTHKGSGKLDSATAAKHPVHLNSAGKDELMTIPGVGNATADLILQYRREHGKFRKVEELRKIPGIGKKKFKRIHMFVVL